MTLTEFTGTEFAQWVSARLGCDLGVTLVEYRDIGVRGRVCGYWWSPRATLLLDTSHPARFEPNPEDEAARQLLFTVCRECVHLAQRKRGFPECLKMVVWRLTVPYKSRPHEVESRQIGDRLYLDWLEGR